jgi:hypothetical protein
MVDARGNLQVPEDYRTAYQFLGAWAIAAEQGNGSQQLPVVYASPGTIAAYRKAGSFPEGSVKKCGVPLHSAGNCTVPANQPEAPLRLVPHLS